MSSTLIVPIVQLQNVRSHPNADKLELADVLGYQMVIPKGKHRSGDRVVYFPADTLMTDEWAIRFGVKEFLRGKDKNRVGKISLRGEPSFGLAATIPEELDADLDDNVAEFFGCKKYQPPIRATAGDAAAYDDRIDPYIQRYTDIENGRIFTGVFSEGEEVVATEKIHGTSCKIGWIRDVDVFAASMGRAGDFNGRRKRPINKDGAPAFFWDQEIKSNTYWFAWSLKGVQELVNKLTSLGNVIHLYGEVFGGSIQYLPYGIPKGQGLGFRAFDISLDGKYLDYQEFVDLCDDYEVPRVPEVYRGPFSIEKMKELADGNSRIDGADNIREGVVVKPLKERVDPKVGRAVLKFIGTQYELGKKNDNTDV